MFGYIKPYKPELKVKEFDTYQAVYCGLCRQLGEAFGPFAKLTLSYDFTFLAMAAMALREDSLSIDDPRLSAEERLAIVLGSEGDGLSDTTIAACDYTVRIPMSHGVDSLNVAAASAVAFWQLGHVGKHGG